MEEAHYLEVEKTLLYVSEARQRCERTLGTLRKEGADQHLLDALERAEADLAATHRRLMQETLFAVPEPQLSMK
jgi:septation ring formation regulator EzrA